MSAFTFWCICSSALQTRFYYGSKHNEPSFLGIFSCFFVVSWFFSKSTFFRKILSGIPSECQTDWIQIRPDILSGLIGVQSLCKGYQQTTLLALFSHVLPLSHQVCSCLPLWERHSFPWTCQSPSLCITARLGQTVAPYYISVNNFSVMSGQLPVFLGWTSICTKQRIKCLAHCSRTQHSDSASGEQPFDPQSNALPTEPLHSAEIGRFQTLTLSPLGNFSCLFVVCWYFFFKINVFEILSGIPSECQTDWIQIRPDILSGLIWVQSVCILRLSADDTSRMVPSCLTPFTSGV